LGYWERAHAILEEFLGLRAVVEQKLLLGKLSRPLGMPLDQNVSR
jgi:hypothetical protein